MIKEDFDSWLKKQRKNNKDKLLESTVNQYLDYFYKLENELCVFDNDEELLSYMNIKLKDKPDMRLYSMFKFYLIYLGHDPRNKNDEILRGLMTPKITGGAFNSTRELQSKVMTKPEIKILTNIVDDEWNVYFSVMYDTACRRNELLNIKFSDIIYCKDDSDDFKNGIGAHITVLGKGYKRRTVYISINTANKVKEYQKIINREYLIRFYILKNKEYIKQDDEFRKRINKICQEKINRHIHPHCFRHTKLQHMADDGVPVLEIKSYAGHSDITATMVYVKNSTYQGKQGFIKSLEI